MKNKELCFLLFLFSYIPLFVVKFIGIDNVNSDYYLISQIIKNILFPMGLLLLMMNSYSELFKKGWLVIFLLTFSAITSFFSKNLSVINLTLILLVFNNINLRLVLNVIFLISIILCLSIIFIFLFDYAAGNAEYLLDTVYGIRYTFGFENPNSFPTKLFLCIILYLYLRKRINLIDVAVSVVISFGIYTLSGSRTYLIMVLISTILLYIHQFAYYLKNKLVQVLAKNCFLILGVISIFSGMYYIEYAEILQPMNELLSGRISMANIVLSEFEIKFLGQDIQPFLENRGIVLDNFYISLILTTGIIFFIFLYFSIYKLFSVFITCNLYKEVLVFIVFLIYGITEKTFLDISSNFSLLFFSILIYKQKILELRK